MGLHLVALLKMNLASSSQRLSPLVGGLLFQFIVKLLLGFRCVRGACGEVVYSWRLFFFQLDQITSESEGGNPADGTRWERAVRLVHRRLTGAGPERSQAQILEDENSMRTLFMLSL